MFLQRPAETQRPSSNRETPTFKLRWNSFIYHGAASWVQTFRACVAPEGAKPPILFGKYFISAIFNWGFSLFPFSPKDPSESARAAVSITDCILLINTWPGGRNLWMMTNSAREKEVDWRYRQMEHVTDSKLSLLLMPNWFGSRSSHSKGEFWVKTSNLATRFWHC